MKFYLSQVFALILAVSAQAAPPENPKPCYDTDETCARKGDVYYYSEKDRKVFYNEDEDGHFSYTQEDIEKSVREGRIPSLHVSFEPYSQTVDFETVTRDFRCNLRGCSWFPVTEYISPMTQVDQMLVIRDEAQRKNRKTALVAAFWTVTTDAEEFFMHPARTQHRSGRTSYVELPDETAKNLVKAFKKYIPFSHGVKVLPTDPNAPEPSAYDKAHIPVY